MANRKRNIQIKFYVTEDEKRLIDERMKLLPTQRYGAYLRKMAIDGYIIYTDTADIKAFTKELFAIGRNINQIAKRINAGGPAYQADMDEIRERLDEIWQLQRHMLCLGLLLGLFQPAPDGGAFLTIQIFGGELPESRGDHIGIPAFEEHQIPGMLAGGILL